MSKKNKERDFPPMEYTGKFNELKIDDLFRYGSDLYKQKNNIASACVWNQAQSNGLTLSDYVMIVLKIT